MAPIGQKDVKRDINDISVKMIIYLTGVVLGFILRVIKVFSGLARVFALSASFPTFGAFRWQHSLMH